MKYEFGTINVNILFDDNGKISVLKEFQSKESHSHPYGESSGRI